MGIPKIFVSRFDGHRMKSNGLLLQVCTKSYATPTLMHVQHEFGTRKFIRLHAITMFRLATILPKT